RNGNALEPIVTGWYNATSGVEGTPAERPARQANLDQVLGLALPPVAPRCAESRSQKVDVSSWTHGHCPYCGWEPDFAVITPSAERRLICGRCTGQWAFASLTCPFCANADRSLVTS